METATPPNESSSIEPDTNRSKSTSDLTPNPHFGHFSLVPTTQTTTVVTTTTVSTKFPPLILKRPRKRVSDWDVTAYPLKDAPTPKELRSFTFEINGMVSEFVEETNPESALDTLQDIVAKLQKSPSHQHINEQVFSSQSSSRRNNKQDLNEFRKRQYSDTHRTEPNISSKRQHMSDTSHLKAAHENRNNPIAPKPARAGRSSDVLDDHSKSGGTGRNVSFDSTHMDDLITLDSVEPASQLDMTSPQSLSLPSPSASPRAFEYKDEGVDLDLRKATLVQGQESQLCDVLNDYPQATSVLEIPKMLDTFDDLPQGVQSYLMYHLLKRCSKTTLQVVAGIVNPALKRDFLDLLPYELSSHIISYLDVRSLTRAAQVSRRWRQLVDEDEYTWKNRLEKDQYYVEDGEFDRAVQQGWDIRTTPARGTKNRLEGQPSSQTAWIVKTQFAEMVDSGLKQPLVGRHLYKAIYQKHHVDYNTWMNPKREPKHLSFESHGRHVVTCLQLDDEKIITGSEDSNINIFDVRTGELRMTLEGHEGGVWALQYLGNTLVSGSTDRTVRIWDMSTGQCLQVLEGHTSTVRCLQILPMYSEDASSSGHIIITGSRDSTLRIWKLPEVAREAPASTPTQAKNPDELGSQYFLRSLLGHTQSVRALAADRDIVVSGSYDCSVRVWQIATGKCLWKLTGHAQKVYSVVLDYSQNRCISGSMDCKVKIWDFALGVCLHTLDGHTSLVGLLSLSHDRLVSAAADSTLRVWNPKTGRCVQSLTAHTGAITCFQHDGDKVISGSDGTLKLWDLKTGMCSRDLLVGLTYVWQVRFDERRCVAAVQRNSTTFIEVLDFGSDQERNSIV
ncbi:putative Cell division control protein Cdc4 [Taphrina deformans PYCC 5710]|uniref:Cell division control protein Cdc4 n=1 Tax=Taphrina deformans (strain PYCC 5710 / ATCC 11124 / CBS 356.35 / IMI 108563 / JCM 9778 / NBRC 8474) TaxID=1097556 RepID=R4XEL2_TAPDE|nr:putative Cell division control protein Cdc4 [Taphrina deformans PYCC 5710]|eukprot:CCG81807.1 putative Cell division control protein Cdc4 [Taphrina deformans PYCC 5710]